jgi:hypothetical protein
MEVEARATPLLDRVHIALIRTLPITITTIIIDTPQ